MRSWHVDSLYSQGINRALINCFGTRPSVPSYTGRIYVLCSSFQDHFARLRNVDGPHKAPSSTTATTAKREPRCIVTRVGTIQHVGASDVTLPVNAIFDWKRTTKITSTLMRIQDGFMDGDLQVLRSIGIINIRPSLSYYRSTWRKY